jgi:Family of unknown function (DUF6152)
MSRAGRSIYNPLTPHLEVAMTRTRVLHATIGLTCLLVAAAIAPVAAHHGWTGYDDKSPQNLTGVIKAAGWENPHGYIDLDVSGKVWRVVLAPPSRMENRGMTREQLKPGATATVMGYPNKTVSTELRAERITIGDRTTELR